MKRVALIVLILLICATFAFARGKKEEGAAASTEPFELSVSYWFGQIPFVDAIKQAGKEFEAKYPHITFKSEHIPYQTYWQKIPAMAVAKQLPDVVMVATILKYTMGPTGGLYDLRPFIEMDPDIHWDEYFEAAKQGVMYENQIIQLPYGLAGSTFVYNLDMYKEAGLSKPGEKFTWDNMLANAQKLTKTDSSGNVEQWGFFKNGPAGQHSGGLPNFILQNGGLILDESGKKAMFDSPEGREALQLWVDMIEKYKVMPTPTIAEGLGDLFETGKLAQANVGSWILPNYKKSADFDWDLHHLPTKKVEVSISCTGGAGFSMAKNTKHPKEAWLLLKAINMALAEVDAASGGEFPVEPAMLAKWARGAGPPYERQAFLDWNLKYAVPRQITPGYLQWRREWQDELVLALNGEKTVEEAMKAGAKKVQAVLDEQWATFE